MREYVRDISRLTGRNIASNAEDPMNTATPAPMTVANASVSVGLRIARPPRDSTKKTRLPPVFIDQETPHREVGEPPYRGSRVNNS
jgi:hypothetical protein